MNLTFDLILFTVVGGICSWRHPSWPPRLSLHTQNSRAHPFWDRIPFRSLRDSRRPTLRWWRMHSELWGPQRRWCSEEPPLSLQSGGLDPGSTNLSPRQSGCLLLYFLPCERDSQAREWLVGGGRLQEDQDTLIIAESAHMWEIAIKPRMPQKSLPLEVLHLR